MTNNTTRVNTGTYGAVTAGAIGPLMQGQAGVAMLFTMTTIDGTAVNLTGKTITGTLQNTQTKETAAIAGAIALVTPASGIFSWTTDADDVGTAGNFKLTFTDGAGLITFPLPLSVVTNPSADTTFSPALVGVTVVQAAWLEDAVTALPDASDLADIGETYYTLLVDAAGGGDHTTLSAAIAAASAGDAIFIRNGTYAGGLTIATNELRLIGESRAGVVIQSPLSSTPAITITGDNVTLERLTVDGRRDEQSGTGGAEAFGGIYISGAQFVTVRNCLVMDTLGNGISATGSNDGVIEKCEIRNTATDGSTPTTGAHLAAVQIITSNKRWRVANNYITGWAQAVGLWYGTQDCLITNNVLYANYGYADVAHTVTRSACEDYGSTAYADHGNNIWSHNVIDGATSECIECAQGVIGSKFIGNICRNANKFGDDVGLGWKIAPGDATEPTYDITLSNNTLYGDATNKSGIYVDARGHVLISGNTIIGCAVTNNSSALILHGTLTRAVVTNNTFRGCQGAVYVSEALAQLTLTNNAISAMVAGAAVITIAAGAGYVVAGNVITDENSAGVTGIDIPIAAGNGHIISHNRITAMTLWCISVTTDLNTITDNYLQTTNVFGVIQLSGALGNQVQRNYCDADNASRTIYLSNSPTYNVITHNWLIGAAATVYESAPGVVTATNLISPNHSGTATNRATAADIVNVPAGAVAGATVQAAINELDTEKLALAGGTMSGGIVMADQLLTRPVIKDYAETVNAIGSIGGGTQDIDLTLGNVVSGTVDTSTTTFTFSNPPASGVNGSFTLYLTNGGSQTVNWPASVKWAGGTAPTLTASGVDILTFTTLDAGTTWYGFLSGPDMS